MRVTNWISVLVLGLGLFGSRAALAEPVGGAKPSLIKWEPWSEAAFERARREHKQVLLDLHAVWCHWCHVMDETTYADPEIAAYINEHFVPVGVDQDSRPDISAKYEDYGWPATIVFAGDKTEIVKRSGYIPPKQMMSMLKAIVADPSPGPSALPEKATRAEGAGTFTKDQIDRMAASFRTSYDPKQGSWGANGQKFLIWDNLEYAISRALAGDEPSREVMNQTLAGTRHLVDPIWGGVYQYSTNEDWEHPHYEKIMQMQAEDMRIYAMAFGAGADEKNLKAAKDIARFLADFLTSPDGAFYTSMDADAVPGEHGGEYFSLSDKDRRAKGIPRIDTNIYSRENGWAIVGLVSLYGASGDSDYLARAEQAAAWVGEHRTISGLPAGQVGFVHGDADVSGPFLGDTLGMGRAYLSLYQATGKRVYLEKAAACAVFIGARFSTGNDGFVSSVNSDGQGFLAVPQREENLALARWANLLARYTARDTDKALALRAAKYLTSPDVSRKFGITVGGLLLLDREMATEPLHLTIIGNPTDAKTTGLIKSALALPWTYKQIDIIDPTLGPLMHADPIEFPTFPEAAAFFCADGRCSSPLFSGDAVRKQFARTVAKK